MRSRPHPSFELRLRVLAAVDYAEGDTIRARIRNVAKRCFIDTTGHEYQFTWRTISTWLYRHKTQGLTSLEPKPRSDKSRHRKVSVSQLAEALHEITPTVSKNKVGQVPKIMLYRRLLERGLFHRSELSLTVFYRIIHENDLLQEQVQQKLRLSFAMKFANELWQADTLHGPKIQQPDGQWRKTFLIAFIDDASRVITHAEFFYHDNTENMIDAFRKALYKRGKPQKLYFDNGSNYISKEIGLACARLNIYLSHAPIRDGAAKGKIERFFRGFRDRFLTQYTGFDSLSQLNERTHHWVEECYNSQHHTGIQMIPIDRFNLDRNRIQFLVQDDYSEEIFWAEEDRKVSKTNLLSIHKKHLECPVDLREQTVQVRFDRSKKDRYFVYFKEKRMGQAHPVNLHRNATLSRQ